MGAAASQPNPKAVPPGFDHSGGNSMIRSTLISAILSCDLFAPQFPDSILPDARRSSSSLLDEL
jgi:hypothetical protein